MSGVVWQISAWTWPALSTVLLAMGAVIWSARRAPADASRWARVGLPALRLVALTALALAMLQPLVSFSDQNVTGHVVALLVDRSRSMATIDANLSDAQRVQLAIALKLLPADARNNPAAALGEDARRAVRQAGELRQITDEVDYARLSGREASAAVRRATQTTADLRQTLGRLLGAAGGESSTAALAPTVDAIRTYLDKPPADRSVRELARRVNNLADDVRKRMDEIDAALVGTDPAVRAATDALRGQSRFDLAKRVTGVAPRWELPGSAGSQVFLFADDLKPLPPGQAIEGTGDAVGPTGLGTDLRQAIAGVTARVPAEKLDAIILLTDGRTPGGESAVSAAQGGGHAETAAPVFPVLIGPWTPQRDVRVVSLDAPPTAMVGETIVAHVELRGTDTGAEPVTVELTADGRVERREVRFEPGEEVKMIDIPVEVQKTGVLELSVAARPLKDEAGEQNNRLSRGVRVVSEKLRVAVLWGESGWDAQYLRNVLLRVAWVNCFEQHLPAGAVCTLSPEQIAQQDLIVLADVPAGALSRQQVEALHKRVQDTGGGVLLLAEDPAVLAGYASDPLLSSFLPYRLDGQPQWRVWPGEEAAFAPVPSRASSDVEMLQIDTRPDETMRQWLARPAMYRLLTLPQLKPNARALLVDRDSQAPMLIETACGSGKALLLAMDESWRWRRTLTGPGHDRFLLDLARYCVEPPYAVTSGRLALDADRTEITPGQSIHVRARIAAPSIGPDAANASGASNASNASVVSGLGEADDAHARLDVLQDGKVIDTRQLDQTLPGSRRFKTVLGDLKPGRYELSFVPIDPDGLPAGPASDAAAPGAADASVRLPLIVHASADRELSDLSTDPQQLERIAQGSGTQLLRLDQIDQLPQRITARAAERKQRTEYAIWCSPYLFAFVLGSFGLEWALRKRVGWV